MQLKNFCPFPVGSVLPAWNDINPISIYLGTTWELITGGKYIQSGTIALSTGGSNSISIGKTNLPNIKLKVDSFSVTTQPHTHPFFYQYEYAGGASSPITVSKRGKDGTNNYAIQNGGGQNTGTASPSTETLGSGTPLNIQPAYITLKFWKRLT